MRPSIVRAGQLFALSGFAVAQPVFDLLGRNPRFFTANRAGPAELVGFALFFLLVPPAILFLSGAIVRAVAGRRAGDIAHLTSVALVSLLLFLPVFERIGLGPLLGVSAAAAIAASLTVAFVRFPIVGRFFLLASAIPVAFLVLFLVTSPASVVLRSPNIGAIDDELHFERTPPIVILRLDEFPLSSLMGSDGTIDAGRYPNFASFASGSTWYRDATTPSDSTRWAVPAMLTGVMPPRWSDRVSAHHPRSMFSALGGTYRFRGSTEGLCPKQLCAGVGSGAPTSRSTDAIARVLSEGGIAYALIVAPTELESRLPPPESLGLDAAPGAPLPLAQDLGRAREPDLRWVRALERIASITRDDRPTLDLISVVLPHRPWRLLPSGQAHSVHDWNPPGLNRGKPWTRSKQEVVNAYQAHLAQVGTADSLLGVLIDRLHETGLYDDALVVVIADHGEAFIPGARFRGAIDPKTVTDVASVPFLMKLPQQEAGRIDVRQVEVTDLFPTIVDVLGIDLPWEFDGHALTKSFTRTSRSMMSSGGGSITIPADMPARVLASARRKYEFTGLPVHAAREVETFYSVGDHAQHIGRPVAELDRGPSSELRFEIEDVSVYDDVDLDADTLPSAVTAFAPAMQARPLIAIAVNGRIAGIVHTVHWNSRERLEVLFWPGFLKKGANKVELYEVDGTGTATTLRAAASRADQ